MIFSAVTSMFCLILLSGLAIAGYGEIPGLALLALAVPAIAPWVVIYSDYQTQIAETKRLRELNKDNLKKGRYA